MKHGGDPLGKKQNPSTVGAMRQRGPGDDGEVQIDFLSSAAGFAAPSRRARSSDPEPDRPTGGPATIIAIAVISRRRRCENRARAPPVALFPGPFFAAIVAINSRQYSVNRYSSKTNPCDADSRRLRRYPDEKISSIRLLVLSGQMKRLFEENRLTCDNNLIDFPEFYNVLYARMSLCGIIMFFTESGVGVDGRRVSFYST